jgi:hypothetical protein
VTLPLGPKALAKEVRASKVLTPALKRYWLEVLPHLHAADRARLHAILGGDAAPEDGQSVRGARMREGKAPSP